MSGEELTLPHIPHTTHHSHPVRARIGHLHRTILQWRRFDGSIGTSHSHQEPGKGLDSGVKSKIDLANLLLHDWRAHYGTVGYEIDGMDPSFCVAALTQHAYKNMLETDDDILAGQVARCYEHLWLRQRLDLHSICRVHNDPSANPSNGPAVS